MQKRQLLFEVVLFGIVLGRLGPDSRLKSDKVPRAKWLLGVR